MPKNKYEEMPEDDIKPTADIEETPEHEQEETPEVEAEEDGGNVKISEDFQKEVTSLLMGATKSELEFIRSEIMEREKELNKAQSKSGLSTDMFSTEGMPE